MTGVPTSKRSKDEGGFVLVMVVMFLFAIAVAGATGYLVVGTEFAMATAAKDGNEALAVARAGLERFVAEQLGQVGDSVSYAIGDGIVQVTTRKVYEEDSSNHLYYLRAEATVANAKYPDIPARRVVSGLAWHRIASLPHRAAVMVSANEIEIDRGGEISGLDSATAADCANGGVDIAGAISLNIIDVRRRGDLWGSPTYTTYANYAAMYDSVALRWDVLQDPNFPVDFEDVLPNYATIPADSFPVIRYNGSKNFGNSWDGRGVLIVTGELDMRNGFNWEGLILAGSVDRRVQGEVLGMVIGGLDGTNPDSRVQYRGDVWYHSCTVYKAALSLSYMDLVDGSVFEVG